MADPALDAGEHLGQAADVRQAAGGIRPRGAQQQVAGLVLAQRVVDQIGVERDLAAGLLLAGDLALDQAGDHRDRAEGAAQHR